VKRTTGQDDDWRLESTGTWTGTHTRTATITRVAEVDHGRGAALRYRLRRATAAASARAGRVSRAVRETLTSAGRFVVGCVVAGALVGPLLGWAIGWVLLVGGGVLLLAALPFLAGGHDYALRLRLDRDRVVAGHAVEGRLEIRNKGRRTGLPAVVDVPVGEGLVEAHVPLLTPGTTHVEPLHIAAHRRGIIDVGPMTLARSDPVGLLRRELRWPQRQTIFVHPVTTPLPATSSGQVHDLEGLPSADIVAADLSFHAIREYQPGDSLRHVHWKSTAKASTLMVREYEESRRSRLAVLLALTEADYLDDDELELAVSVAASIGAQGVRDGREMYVAAGEEPPRVTRGVTVTLRALPVVSARTLLDATCELERTARSTRVEDIASLAAQASPDMTVAFLVVGSRVDVARISAAAGALPLGTQVVAVRCEIDGEPSARSTRRVTVLTVGRLGDLGRLLARGALS
jgi:uncharacterized protein (DUF58 family)